MIRIAMRPRPLRRMAALFFGWALVACLAAGPALAADDRLALKGFDPVAYFTMSRAVPGDRQFETEWDGAVYRFVSADHMARFKADPDRYLPQYGSLCTASLAGGRKFTPDPRYWLVHDGRLFLFGQPGGVQRMAANPVAFKAKADAGFARLSRPAPH